jgi:hypothetical protein
VHASGITENDSQGGAISNQPPSCTIANLRSGTTVEDGAITVERDVHSAGTNKATGSQQAQLRDSSMCRQQKQRSAQIISAQSGSLKVCLTCFRLKHINVYVVCMVSHVSDFDEHRIMSAEQGWAITRDP